MVTPLKFLFNLESVILLWLMKMQILTLSLAVFKIFAIAVVVFFAHILFFSLVVLSLMLVAGCWYFFYCHCCCCCVSRPWTIVLLTSIQFSHILHTASTFAVGTYLTIVCVRYPFCEQWEQVFCHPHWNFNAVRYVLWWSIAI